MTSYLSRGGYTAGTTNLQAGKVLYFYVGGKATIAVGGYNGGGNGYSATAIGGGGATDARYFGDNIPSDLTWNTDIGLKSRIMVAAGGGGGCKSATFICGAAGGIIGITGQDTHSSYVSYIATGGTQNSGGIVTNYSNSNTAGTNGSFGVGGNGGQATNGGSGGGGGGYYGGAGGSRLSSGTWPAGGGSSYISGHAGCLAILSDESIELKQDCDISSISIECSTHYSGIVFTDTLMIDGNGFKWEVVDGIVTADELEHMPNPLGGTYEDGGNINDGYVRITYVGS